MAVTQLCYVLFTFIQTVVVHLILGSVSALKWLLVTFLTVQFNMVLFQISADLI